MKKLAAVFLAIMSCFIAFPAEGSVPQGVVWEKILDEKDLYGRDLHFSMEISSLVVDPRNPSIMYIGTSNPFDAPLGRPGIYKSTDSGRTWRLLSGVASARSILINPQNGNHILANDGFTVWQSFNGGKTWSRSIGNVNEEGFNRGGFSYPIHLTAYPDFSHLYVWTRTLALNNRHEKYLSIDGGRTWERINKLPIHNLFIRFFDSGSVPMSVWRHITNPHNPDHFLSNNGLRVLRGRMKRTEKKVWSEDETLTVYSLAGRKEGPPVFTYLEAYPDFSRLYIWAFDVPREDGGKEDLFFLSTDQAKTWVPINALPASLPYVRSRIKFPDGLWHWNFASPDMTPGDGRDFLSPDMDIISVPGNESAVLSVFQKNSGKWAWPSPRDGLYLTVNEGNDWYRVPGQPKVSYASLFQAVREEGKTVVFLKLYRIRSFLWTKSVPGAGIESIWRVEIPDRFLENPREMNRLELVLMLGSKQIFVSGRETKTVAMDVAPIVRDGRTFVPLRFVTETIGGTVAWVRAENRIDIVRNGRTIRLWLGRPTAEADGRVVPIDSGNSRVAPVSIRGRTMIPLRFVAESLGCEVKWFGRTGEIRITTY